MIKIYNYYTLKEANEIKLQGSNPYVDLDLMSSILSNYLSITKTTLEARSEIKWEDLEAGGLIDKLWNSIANKYQDCYIIKEEADRWDLEHPTLNDGSYAKWIQRLLSKIIKSYKKYSKLFEIYTSVEDNLMKKIESHQTSTATASNTASNKFNDTPQVYDGDYDADKFTSEYREAQSQDQSHNEAIYSSDQASPIKRIEEIQNIYADLLSDWTAEMYDLFISINE